MALGVHTPYSSLDVCLFTVVIVRLLTTVEAPACEFDFIVEQVHRPRRHKPKVARRWKPLASRKSNLRIERHIFTKIVTCDLEAVGSIFYTYVPVGR